MAGFVIKWFDEVDSTNSRIASDCSVLQGNTVYAAYCQSEGRGQQGNRWHSQKGMNLTFSILIRPCALPVRWQASLCHATALGLTDYLESKGVEARIKWPNDIYCGDKKICGILIENSISSSVIKESIIGIGLNVNQTEFDGNIPNPTSLALETGRDYVIEMELEPLLECLVKRFQLIDVPYTRNRGEIDYMDRLYRRGEWHLFEAMEQNDIPTEKRTGERFTGRILGTDDSFRLIVEKKSGIPYTFAFKEIKYVI